LRIGFFEEPAKPYSILDELLDEVMGKQALELDSRTMGVVSLLMHRLAKSRNLHFAEYEIDTFLYETHVRTSPLRFGEYLRVHRYFSAQDMSVRGERVRGLIRHWQEDFVANVPIQENRNYMIEVTEEKRRSQKARNRRKERRKLKKRLRATRNRR